MGAGATAGRSRRSTRRETGSPSGSPSVSHPTGPSRSAAARSGSRRAARGLSWCGSSLARRRAPQRLAAGEGGPAVAGRRRRLGLGRRGGPGSARAPRSAHRSATASINVGNGPSSVAVGRGRGVGRQPARPHALARRPAGECGDRDAERRRRRGRRGGRRERVGRRRGREAAGAGRAGGRVAEKLPVESRPTALTGGSSLWVAAGAAPAGHRGGKLLVESSFCNKVCLDPSSGFGQGWESLTLVYDSLLGYRRVPGVAGRPWSARSPPRCRSRSTAAAPTSSRSAPAFASPTGGRCVPPTSALRWSVRSA